MPLKLIQVKNHKGEASLINPDCISAIMPDPDWAGVFAIVLRGGSRVTIEEDERERLVGELRNISA